MQYLEPAACAASVWQRAFSFSAKGFRSQGPRSCQRPRCAPRYSRVRTRRTVAGNGEVAALEQREDIDEGVDGVSQARNSLGRDSFGAPP